MNELEFLIIGGGPTGLGAACRLHEKGRNWRLLEAENHFGGLSASFVDQQGFWWDLGGHVHFSHYETFDRFLEKALGLDGWLEHRRESWIWVCRRFVPYPIQNNLHRLDAAERWACIEGLLDVTGKTAPVSPANFAEWMRATFGEGLCGLFMSPYNRKVWAWPAEEMDYHWIGERVSVPPLKTVLRSICLNRDEDSWGPNRLFRFPRFGGTGAIWKSLGEGLPADRISLGARVVHIDAGRKTAQLEDGSEWKYRRLITSMPMNKLIEAAPGVVNANTSTRLVFAGTHVVGVGLEGPIPANLKTKCWMYFPEANSPYYRVTAFSNYSPNNVPSPGGQWSLMTETSESARQPVDRGALVERTVGALREDSLIPEGARIISTAHYHRPQGYPTPFLGRDAVVDPVLRAFESEDIFSRGRFGAWKYEVGNMDHSFMQGYECASRLLADGGPDLEPTLFTPGFVNARRNP